jgi:competence protein ComEC
MGLGFLLLAAGLLVPSVAGPIGPCFDASLRGMLWVTQAAADWHWGHVSFPAAPTWWVIGFYLLLLVAWRLVRVPIVTRRGWLLLGMWTILGLSLGLLPTERCGLKVTALAVGHGSATVLELPNGQTLAYDVGTFGDGRRAGDIMAGCLWQQRIARLDAVMISHADVDHFNGVTTLLETVPVGTIFCGRSFLDFTQEAVVDLCETAARRGIPIRILQAGDRLGTGDRSVALSVLHPTADFDDENDNANSIVLLAESAGRKILLTGDVEGAGQVQLQQSYRGPFDVVFAPHHGAKSTNPPGFYQWASPTHVVVSTSDEGVDRRIEEINAAGVQVLSTRESGAIEVQIAPDGDIRLKAFLQD